MEKMIALLFLSRELAHRAHLRTNSIAAHEALGSFYDGVVGFADKLAETWMGYDGKKLDDIPLLENEFEGDIIEILEQQAAWIEDNRPDGPSFILNIIDEILAHFYSHLYKLRELH